MILPGVFTVSFLVGYIFLRFYFGISGAGVLRIYYVIYFHVKYIACSWYSPSLNSNYYVFHMFFEVLIFIGFIVILFASDLQAGNLLDFYMIGMFSVFSLITLLGERKLQRN